MHIPKLLQLDKATAADIDIIYNVSLMLSPSQIQRMYANYVVADYEVHSPSAMSWPLLTLLADLRPARLGCTLHSCCYRRTLRSWPAPRETFSVAAPMARTVLSRVSRGRQAG